ncbi:unnamed protein product [Phyllotreta striolata]|uniref:Vesicular, overexpressed in cancer, prosurvival protein 1 n=1 Tax=Phyllotreta striolata TaxID=444603 RepID=A0A9N9XHS4_PHYSR|nr:unnamed protein product [Phyllotreta striolata]
MLFTDYMLSLCRIESIVLITLTFLYDVKANYCAFGTCNEDEYCCGENICCRKSSDIWYLWVLGAVAFLVLFVFYVWIKFRKNRHINYSNQYHPLFTNEPEMEMPIS